MAFHFNKPTTLNLKFHSKLQNNQHADNNELILQKINNKN